MTSADAPVADRPDAPAASGPQVRHGAIQTLGFSLARLPLTFVVSVITGRFLLPEGRGAFVLALLTVDIAGRLLYNDAAVIHLLSKRQRPEAVLLQALIQDSIFGFLAIAVLLPADFLFLGDAEGDVWIAALAIPPILAARSVAGFMLGQGRLRIWNVIQILPPALTVSAMLVLVAGLSLKLNGALVAWTAAQGLVALYALFSVRDNLRGEQRSTLSRADSRWLLSLSVRLGFVSLITLLHYRASLFLIQAYLGLAAVGIYSIAIALAELLYLLPQAVSSAIVSPSVRADEAEAAEIIAKGARHAFVATTAAGIVLAAAAPAAVPVIYGSAFDGSVKPLLVLIVAAVATAPSGPLAVYFSMKLGRSRYTLATVSVSASVTIGFAVLLVPRYGVIGAALSTLIGYAVSQVVEVVWFIRASDVRGRLLLPRTEDLLAYRDLVRSIGRRLAAATR